MKLDLGKFSDNPDTYLEVLQVFVALWAAEVCGNELCSLNGNNDRLIRMGNGNDHFLTGSWQYLIMN
jgi:hypothetical protein